MPDVYENLYRITVQAPRPSNAITRLHVWIKLDGEREKKMFTVYYYENPEQAEAQVRAYLAGFLTATSGRPVQTFQVKYEPEADTSGLN